MLKRISLLSGRVVSWQEYPFSVPAIQSFRELTLHSRLCFFVGENGSGKSTLLEAIASHYGFGREGGTRNFQIDSTESNQSIEPLAKALRLAFDVRTGYGFFLRAETLFNAATYLDNLDGGNFAYGGKSLHERSHGETFFTVLDLRFRENGLFLLDEPEAALSPQRQLALLVLLHDTLKEFRDAQFIISTHSPILLGMPGAQIISFDDGKLHEIAYEQTASYQITRRFVTHRQRMLEDLFQETPSLFPEPSDADIRRSVFDCGDNSGTERADGGSEDVP